MLMLCICIMVNVKFKDIYFYSTRISSLKKFRFIQTYASIKLILSLC